MKLRYVPEPVMGYHLPHPEAKPPNLNPENVPAEFRHLIPLAEKYGVSDDGYRIEMLDSLDDSERTELAQFLADYDDSLDSWLAGPEANSPTPTAEYVAFSCLRMAHNNVWPLSCGIHAANAFLLHSTRALVV